MAKQGFIKLYRQIQEHWIFEEKRKFSKFEAWTFMLMAASHKDNKFVLGNEVIELKRGQFVTSELKLMERFDWGKAKLRSFLEMLEKDGMIVKKSDRKKTTITICNYSVYHDSETENRPQADRKQTDNRPIADTIKNVKEESRMVKNEKEEILLSAFETFWTAYPRKLDKKKALEKFKTAAKKHDPQIIIDGALNYAKECEAKGTEKSYIKHPTTFLNAESFLNDFDISYSKGGQVRTGRGIKVGKDNDAEVWARENEIPF